MADPLARLLTRRSNLLGLIHIEDRPLDRAILRIQLAELEAATIELAAALGRAGVLPVEMGRIEPRTEILTATTSLLWGEQ